MNGRENPMNNPYPLRIVSSASEDDTVLLPIADPEGTTHIIRNDSDRPLQVFAPDRATIEIPPGEARVFVTVRKPALWRRLLPWLVFALTMFAIAWIATR